MHDKKLHRSRTDKMVAGVAGGLAEYFNIDPVIVRVLFVITVFVGGGGILAYIILWIVLPEAPYEYSSQNAESSEKKKETSTGSNKNSAENGFENVNFNGVIESAKDNRKILGGAILIGIGMLFLLDNLIPRFDAGDYWPLILIGVGVGIIIKSQNN